MSSCWLRFFGIFPSIQCMASSESFQVATFPDSGLIRSWWYPCLMSSWKKTGQSWNLYKKNFKRSYSGFLCLATKHLHFLSPRAARVGTILRHFSVSSVRTPVNVSLWGLDKLLSSHCDTTELKYFFKALRIISPENKCVSWRNKWYIGLVHWLRSCTGFESMN